MHNIYDFILIFSFEIYKFGGGGRKIIWILYGDIFNPLYFLRFLFIYIYIFFGGKFMEYIL